MATTPTHPPGWNGTPMPATIGEFSRAPMPVEDTTLLWRLLRGLLISLLVPVTAASSASVPIIQEKLSEPEPASEVLQAPAPIPSPIPVTPDSDTTPASPSTTPQTGYVEGIDLSHWQGTVDWKKVADDPQEVSFVFIKCSDGFSRSGSLDEQFQNNWLGAKDQGIPRGAYHFFNPAPSTIQRQIDQFKSCLADDPGELPPVVDIEKYNGHYDGYSCDELTSIVKTFLQGLQHELGTTPMIYTNPSTWKSLFCSRSTLSAYPLWLAEYSDRIHLPRGWKRWLFWQYSSKGAVGGLDPVDVNRFSGSAAELDALMVTPD